MKRVSRGRLGSVDKLFRFGLSSSLFYARGLAVVELELCPSFSAPVKLAFWDTRCLGGRTLFANTLLLSCIQPLPAISNTRRLKRTGEQTPLRLS